MKLMAALLLIACLQTNAKVFGQGTVTLSLRDVLVTEVFKEIEKQTPFRFLYKDELVKKAGVITIAMKDATVEQVLNRCFDKKPLEYKIFKETIVISEKSLSASGGGTSVPEETLALINVTGRVLNEQGKPVEGVTVTIKGTDKSTFTNANGEFFLSSVEQDAIITFSAVNMEPFEVKVSGQTELVVNLKAKVSELGGVEVVHTGYQDVQKDRATGSFVHVNNELLNRRVSSDILSRLEGVTSGVLFDRTSGNSLGISVRGRSTIYANTQPLVIVDNFPYNGDINEINPNDVENITILKDAAAASIWGAKAGNGVIVITTKRGKYNQPIRVDINSNISISESPDLYYDRNFLNSKDFLQVEKFLFDYGFYNGDLDNSSYPVISPAVEVYDKISKGLLTQAEGDAILAQYQNNDVRRDYEKYLFRKQIDQQYSLSLSGGTNKTAYFISAGFDRGIANVRGNESNRLTLNSSTIFKPISNLEITGQLIIVNSKFENNGLSSVSAGGKYTTLYPYAQLADASGNPLPVTKDYRMSFAEDPMVNGMLDWRYYPLRELELNDNISKTFSARMVGRIRYTVLPGLSVEGNYQHQRSQATSRSNNSQESYLVRNLVNKYSEVLGTDIGIRPIPIGAIVNNSNGELVSNSVRAQINFDKKHGEHEISAIAGIEATETKNEGSSSTLYGYNAEVGTTIPVDFVTDFLLYPSYESAKIPGAPIHNQYTLDRFRSFFGNASYTYRGRYTASGSARLDQSNLVGVKTNQKGIPLWSAGLKWDIDREEFFKSKWISLLKLRATYGFNGNLDKSLTAFTTAVFQTSDLLNGTPYAEIDQPGNSSLRWEKIGMFNAAVDFGAWNNVITGTIEYFHKKGVDIIGNSTIASSSGFQVLRGNFSNMVSDGVDLILNTNVERGELKWNTNFLITYVKDKVTKNDGNDLQMVGKPVVGVFAYKWGGLDEMGDPVGYLDKEKSKNYSGIITDASTHLEKLSYLGSGSPVVFGSIRNSFGWKGFALSANVTYKLGYYFKRSSISYNSLFYSGKGHVDYSDRWQTAGDENRTNVPAMVNSDYDDFSSRDAFYLGSEVLVEKGDHIRLQDIRLSYSFPRKHLQSLKLGSLQAYLYINNLGIIWRSNKKGVDPDFLDKFPNPRSYSFGVRMSL